MKRKNTITIAQWRFYCVLAVLAGLVLVLVVRVASLQVIDGVDRGYEFLQDQGNARTIRKQTIPAHRGMITDRRGEPLAVSTPVVSITANPKTLLENPQRWSELAKALGMPRAEFEQKLHYYREKDFMYLRRHMVPQEAEKIALLGIPGIFREEEYRRYYPAGEVTAHMVGFTNIDDQGQEGIELAYDDWLKGEAGSKKVMKDLKGRVLKEIQQVKEASPGKDLALSLDLRLQYLAYRELKAAIKYHRARAGSVVVLDTHTGEILAMANQPSYNPNNRHKLEAGAIRNRAITDVFEPGSTVKPLTITAALESGKYTPHTPIDTSPGRYRVGHKTLMDPVNYGLIDVTKVITKSSQVGASKIALSLDEQAVREVFHRFGLGEATGTGFPGESTGILPNYVHWKPIERASFAYGYGLNVTALQLARAYTVFATGGKKLPVSLLRQDHEVSGEQVLSEKYADDVIDMLRTVTLPGGTAVAAQVPSYTVAGKSGTAHKVGAKGYEYSKYVSLFAGMAPASDPRIVTVVVVDDPKGNEYYGGEVAAPVFSQVVAGAMRLMDVPPDDAKYSAQLEHPAAGNVAQQSRAAAGGGNGA